MMDPVTSRHKRLVFVLAVASHDQKIIYLNAFSDLQFLFKILAISLL